MNFMKQYTLKSWWMCSEFHDRIIFQKMFPWDTKEIAFPNLSTFSLNDLENIVFFFLIYRVTLFENKFCAKTNYREGILTGLWQGKFQNQINTIFTLKINFTKCLSMHKSAVDFIKQDIGVLIQSFWFVTHLYRIGSTRKFF